MLGGTQRAERLARISVARRRLIKRVPGSATVRSAVRSLGHTPPLGRVPLRPRPALRRSPALRPGLRHEFRYWFELRHRPAFRLRDQLVLAPRRALAACAAAVVCLAAGGSVAPNLIGASAASAHTVVIPDPTPQALPNVSVAAAGLLPPAPLPAAVTAPAPAPPELSTAVLKPHEVFGFAPYWTLATSSGFDLTDLTTVAYFGVDAAGDGSLIQSDPGWNGYQSQALADLISRAHAAGDRVVLSVECFDQPSLDRLTRDPAAQAKLADNLIAATAAKAMDGLNIDFEGLGSSDRAGMVGLIRYLSSRVRAANQHWQLTVDTYAGSATDSNGFFDVASMAPAVDAFFVMAYDMYQSGVASPTAPLQGPGASDESAVEAYASVVPASKVILGVPFYGYQWQTSSNGPRAQATSGPVPISYGQLLSASLPIYWDAQGQVPWTAYQDGQQQWHEVYFDDPQSVALKAQAADYAHLLGVGIWALGMDGNDPAMMSALLGHSPVVKNYQTGPTTISPSASTTTSSSTTSTTHPKQPTTTTTTKPSAPNPLAPSSPSTTQPPPSKGPAPPVTIPLVGGSKSGI